MAAELNVQRDWAAKTVVERVKVLRRARRALAARSAELVEAIPAELSRTRADSYGSEILPLLAACEFLEREAAEILSTRRLGNDGLPFWLTGVETAVERVPFGVVLVIGPSNYPLFLTGVQVLQALAAGNAAVWKPGRGGEPVARKFAAIMANAGLPEGLLRVTDESVEAGLRELRAGVDKIIFTGSSGAGREILRLAAETATPAVTELSGCDAVVVLPSADVKRVVMALKFGMRLNGSATCMAPRRLVLVGEGFDALVARIRDEFAAMDAMPVFGWERLRGLLEEAQSDGATVHGEASASMRPVLVVDAHPQMAIAQADIFAPVLTVLRISDGSELANVDAICPFGLAAAVFGAEAEASKVASTLKVGTVTVNDLIVPTADPRVSFGGRRGSGSGVTRGREGLLEMTAVRVIAVRKSKNTMHYQQTGDTHETLLRGAAALSHGEHLRTRVAGLKQIVSAAWKLRKTL